MLDGAHELAKRQLTLAAHEEIDVGLGVGVRGQAGVVPADDHADPAPEAAEQLSDSKRGPSLEGHHRESHHVRLDVPNEALERLRHAALDEDQIGDRHPVVGIDVARERGQRPVGHPNGHRRHVLERVGHR